MGDPRWAYTIRSYIISNKLFPILIASGNAIIATNSNATGTGVRGIGGTFGVYGMSANTGVIGDSFAGRGIEGNSNSGYGILGVSVIGNAGYFQNNTNTNPTIKIQNNTSGGTALDINGAIKVSGTNPADFKITSTAGNITNGAPVRLLLLKFQTLLWQIMQLIF